MTRERGAAAYPQSRRSVGRVLTLALAMFTLTPIVITVGASVAWAQPISSSSVTSVNIAGITVDTLNVDASNNTWTLNLGNCRDNAASQSDLTFTWDFGGIRPDDAQYSIKRQFNGESCSTSSFLTEPSDECTSLTTSQNLNSLTLTQRFSWAQTVNIISNDECDERNDSYDVISIFTAFGASEDDTDAHAIRIAVDTRRPDAPSDFTASAGESSISASWSSVDDATSYEVFYAIGQLIPGEAPEDLGVFSRTTNSTSISITADVEQNRIYWLGVTSRNSLGNASLLSTVETVVTQPVVDFYEFYRQSGGAERGGTCATSPQQPVTASWLVLLAVGALVSTRRWGHRR